jgi:hypothetical protein
MKASWIKSILCYIPALTIFIPACGGEMSKYEWMASESAPKGYPMQILDGSSFYDEKGGGLYIPSGKKMHDGWGTEVSLHVVGEDKKNLPNRFDVLYFSYTENSFFQGGGKLPLEHIENLFKVGYYSPKLNRHTTYEMIIVGVAPGGFVSAWLKGIDRTTEIFSGQASKVDIPWTQINSSKKISREEYVQKILEREIGQDGIDGLKENGIPYGRWEKYRKRYDWTPIVTGVKMPAVINVIRFINGERDYYSPKYGNDWSEQTKAVPIGLYFVWKYGKDYPLALEVDFDEEEIFNAFEVLSKKTNLPIKFNINIEERGNMLFYQFTLGSGDETIQLKKGNYEQYKAALTDESLQRFLDEN